VCCALAALLALTPDAAPPGRTAVLVDASASVRRGRPGWPAWMRGRVRALGREAADRGEELVVIAFARDVERAFGPAPAGDAGAWLDGVLGGGGAPWLPVPAGDAELASDLAGALAAAGPLLEEAGVPGRLHLLGDACATGEEPAPRLAALRAAGHGVRIEEPPEGAPLAVTVLVALEPGAALPDLELTAGPLRAEATVPPGGGAVLVRAGVLPPGVHEVRARLVHGEAADAVPENDHASAWVRVGGARAVAVAARPARATDAERLARAVSGRGLRAEVLTPEDLAPALPRLDAVLVLDAPPSALPVEALAGHVRGGGGLAVAAGWSGMGGWERAPALADLLPLRFERGEDTERDVVLLVDGSGSMAGEPFERVRAAAVELALAAPPEDALSLRFFSARLLAELVVRERGASAREAATAMRRLLAARVPGGATAILDSLDDLATERAATGRACLAVLLTDGREREEHEDLAAAVAETRGRLADAGVELVVVATGQAADLEILAALAGGAAEVRAADAADADGFVELLVREVQRAGVLTGTRALVSSAVAGGLAAEAVGADAPPPVEVLARARVAPGAEAPWRDEEGAPALGLWRAGAGRAAVLASAPGSEWAPAWGAGAHLAPLLRWLADRPDEAPRLTRAGTELVLDVPASRAGALPAVLDGELVPAGSGAPGSAEGGARGSVRLMLDPLSGTWRGPAPATGREPLLVRLAPPDGPALPLPGGAPVEFEAARSSLAGLEGPPGEADSGRARAPRPDLLALGALLLGAGGLLAARGGGQGMGGAGR
jgi:Mg-chelatase subunit ChlD